MTKLLGNIYFYKMKLFLSIGAMKAGTTWLYSHLQKHSQLYFTPEKEIHFLSHHFLKSNVLQNSYRYRQAKRSIESLNDVHIGKYKEYLRWYAMYLEQPDDFKWYERVFSLNKKKEYNCDFSNLTCHLSKEDWKTLNDRYELKVLYILRDPIKRLWSHVKFHNMFIGDSPDYETWGISEFEDFVMKPHIWINTHYHKNIQTLQSALPPERFKIIFFEEMISKPEKYLSDIEDFLGIDNLDYTEDLFKKVNTSNSKKMPESLRNHAEKLLEKEYTKLANAGISHEKWSK